MLSTSPTRRSTLLLDVGWFPGNVALLTTGKRHDVQVEETERLGQGGYWETFWDEDEVFYGHVLGCKGLERPAVVLCVNEARRATAPGRGCTSGCRAPPTS